MVKEDNLKLDKYIGALVGAAAGDALGWPNEQNSRSIGKENPKDKEMFQKWTRREGGKFWSHNEEIYPGEYSDDTQLIIATARSLRRGSAWSRYFTRIELPAWLSYERGGGGATKRAAEAWKKESSPWNLEKEKKQEIERYFGAGGNGVAMRILPHVFVNGHSWEEISHQVFINGISTHGHPRALIGALVYADALLYLLNNEKTLGYGELVDYLLKRKDKWSMSRVQKIDSWVNAAEIISNNKYMNLWADVTEEVIELLRIARAGLEQGALDMGNEVLENLGCFDKKVNGSGTITAVAAIYLASKYASSPRLALTEAAYLKNADTDTLASMVGGLLGMLHGSEFISVSWLNVQDYSYLKELVQQQIKVDDYAKAPILDYSNPNMKNKLKHMKLGDQLIAHPFGKLTLKDKRLNKSNAKGAVVHTLKLVSEEGQSIFIKTFEKSPEEELISKEKPLHPTTTQPNTGSRMQLSYSTAGKFKTMLDANKIRGLVNILPENLKTDLCFLFIADVMDEVERNGAAAADPKILNYLLQRWDKHRINIKDIEKIVKVILEY